ncbi:MAG TPA: YbaB/EbfC family nucleoid-associated protein [Thermotogota bacterium]|nr:YbaB/EbfC family nucleoid-associated protein [Thermotogota bacterium]
MAKKMRSFGGKSFRKPSGAGQPKVNQLIQKAQQAQEEMQKKEEEFNEQEFEFSVGGGALTIKMKGDHTVTAIDFEEDLLDEPDDFKDLVIAAFNQGVEECSKKREELMGDLGNDLGLGDLGF